MIGGFHISRERTPNITVSQSRFFASCYLTRRCLRLTFAEVMEEKLCGNIRCWSAKERSLSRLLGPMRD
ncbi:hypothetical protein p1D6 (plasmid) [Aromatoleum aromaticum EbN1]|uniref:Uncharacterized protein n=1 Tax=Aromatoleum aromaticum (strain DSM 19018 / LMG 30748 / EbN1) TaxID=76114 RepID=Q5NX96_AROAE|nr:hypothetical protein p1D6 [Aromatoleum aromaticum EbN1]